MTAKEILALAQAHRKEPSLANYTALADAVKAMERDTKRMDYIVASSRAFGLSIDGMHSWSTMHHRDVRGTTLREAIDNALKAQS